MRQLTELKSADWQNGVKLNIKKTKELIIDFRRHQELLPLERAGEEVERGSSFKFLGTHVSENFRWTINSTALVKEGQTLCQAAGVTLSVPSREFTDLLYHGLVWELYSGRRAALQRVITGLSLPPPEDIYRPCCLSRACSIIKDSTHLFHHLFAKLSSGRKQSSKDPHFQTQIQFLPNGQLEWLMYSFCVLTRDDKISLYVNLQWHF